MRIRRILSLHLSSSGLFALGTALPVISYAISYYNNDSPVSVVLIELFSWILLACHVLPEIIIDLNTFPKAKRKLPHTRYGTGPCTNFVQSMLFASSCILQGIFFANTWSLELYSENSQEELQAYEFLNLIAGHIWLLSGLIALCSVGSSCSANSSDGAGFWEKVADDIYVLSTVTICVAGWIMLLSRPAGHILHVIVRCVWCVLGAFYFMNDLVEEYLYRGSVSVEGQKKQKKLLSDDDMT